MKETNEAFNDIIRFGLDSEGGELSLGNLVFKLLRRNLLHVII